MRFWRIVSFTAVLAASLFSGPRFAVAASGDVAPLNYYPIDRRAEFTMSLNGTWRFELGKVTGDFTQADYDDTLWEPIKVPGNWELQGFEQPGYGLKGLASTDGFYRRCFTVPAPWKGRRVFIRFEGVAFGFEFWIDGKRVGAFSSPFNRSEFDVTDFVVPGRRSHLAVRVTRRDKGWDFDVHDDWSLSGIHRDVVLFSLPDTRIKDYTVTTPVSADGKQAAVRLNVALENLTTNAATPTLSATIIDRHGTVVGSMVKAVNLNGNASGVAQGEINIGSPELWTAETPTLYTLDLDLSVDGKHLHQITDRVGLREIEAAGGVFKINGKPVKIHGVNHHDLHPQSGRAMTRDQYIQDLEMMKAANINAIRTCHYPPQKMFLDLCDEYGMYVLDEVPFGSFGASKENLRDESYADNLALRAQATVARDKNQTCVVLWTVGNEIPYTPLVVRTAGLLKQLDPSRPRCVPHPTDMYYFPLPPELDILDAHYLQTGAMGQNPKSKAPLLEDIFKHPDITAPVLMSEFAHAQGSSMEDLKSCWDMMESSDRFMGGCVWLFQDQGLYRKVPANLCPGIPKVVDGAPVEAGKVKAQTWVAPDLVIDSAGAGGKDGLVDADRYPKSGYWAVRKVFAPVVVPTAELPVKAGRQTIRIPIQNRFDFTDLASVSTEWELHVDGKTTQQGTAALQAPPRGSTVFESAVDIPENPQAHDIFLRLSFADRNHRDIIEHTVRLLATASPENPYISWFNTKATNGIVHSEAGPNVTYGAENCFLTVNRETGNIRFSIAGKSTPVFDGIGVRVGREPQMSETRAYGAIKAGFWEPYLLTNAIVEAVAASAPNGGGARIDLKLRYNREGTFEPGKHGSINQAIIADVHFTFSAQGWLDVDYTLSPMATSDYLLEIGLVLKLPAASKNLTWLGKGPYAVYPAQAEGMERGVYSIAPDPGFDPINRIYAGNRTEVDIAAATDAMGNGLGVVCEDATVSLEPENGGTFFSHLLRAAGHGEKRRVSLITIDGSSLKPLSGTMRLVPLAAGQWPSVFRSVLANPLTPRDVFAETINGVKKSAKANVMQPHS